MANSTIAEKIAQAETERQRIAANIADAYDEAEAKGATMPATKNSDNLADTVASIPTGSTPTLITKQITENGNYTAADDNADGYSNVTVAVPVPELFFTTECEMYTENMVFTNNVTSIPNQRYRNANHMKTVKFTSVQIIGFYCFQNCPLTNIEFNSELATINNYSFTNLKNAIVDLSAFLNPNEIPAIDVNVFNSTAIFEVANQEMLNAFSGSTNWSRYAGNMRIKGATT